MSRPISASVAGGQPACCRTCTAPCMTLAAKNTLSTPSENDSPYGLTAVKLSTQGAQAGRPFAAGCQRGGRYTEKVKSLAWKGVNGSACPGAAGPTAEATPIAQSKTLALITPPPSSTFALLNHAQPDAPAGLVEHQHGPLLPACERQGNAGRRPVPSERHFGWLPPGANVPSAHSALEVGIPERRDRRAIVQERELPLDRRAPVGLCAEDLDLAGIRCEVQHAHLGRTGWNDGACVVEHRGKE